jgi:hypothetical protein
MDSSSSIEVEDWAYIVNTTLLGRSKGQKTDCSNQQALGCYRVIAFLKFANSTKYIAIAPLACRIPSEADLLIPEVPQKHLSWYNREVRVECSK